MDGSDSDTKLRRALLGTSFAFGMALVGSGMFLASLMMGVPLTGTAFNLAWILVSVGLCLSLFWFVAYLRVIRRR
ncbi:hypothetical protein [Crystallibacter degradans]|uniref:hypothetical protein n=1 Tax=Crystallibacter degradans TaxID=2726743 RepID=UPI0014745C8A|nr:hypothetical protein [Arthrobacter sp. SF27]NMR31855.1 hypothetical protein [Arthrobacter sp. SF27]